VRQLSEGYIFIDYETDAKGRNIAAIFKSNTTSGSEPVETHRWGRPFCEQRLGALKSGKLPSEHMQRALDGWDSKP